MLNHSSATNSGMSLVQLIFGMGITAIVVLGIISYLNFQQKATTLSDRKAGISTDLTRLNQHLRLDYKSIRQQVFRTNGTTALTGSAEPGMSIYINLASDPNMLEKKRVIYKSICGAPQKVIATQIAQIKTAMNAELSKYSGCPVVSCANNQVSTIERRIWPKISQSANTVTFTPLLTGPQWGMSTMLSSFMCVRPMSGGSKNFDVRIVYAFLDINNKVKVASEGLMLSPTLEDEYWE